TYQVNQFSPFRGSGLYNVQRPKVQPRPLNKLLQIDLPLKLVSTRTLEEIPTLSKPNKIDTLFTTATFLTHDNSLSQSTEGSTEIFHISIRFICSVFRHRMFYLDLVNEKFTLGLDNFLSFARKQSKSKGHNHFSTL
ncbi:MAG: hypothetical protein VYA61_04540, partial [Pseudomonadota bacterium]|nr:hypothetical protein [Pseudomonadota bacterium]